MDIMVEIKPIVKFTFTWLKIDDQKSTQFIILDGKYAYVCMNSLR